MSRIKRLEEKVDLLKREVGRFSVDMYDTRLTVSSHKLTIETLQMDVWAANHPAKFKYRDEVVWAPYANTNDSDRIAYSGSVTQSLVHKSNSRGYMRVYSIMGELRVMEGIPEGELTLKV